MPAKPGGAERGLGPGRRQQGSRAASPATAAREQQLVATAACGPWSRCVCRAGHTRGRAWESGAWSRAWAQPGSAFSGAREPGWTGHPSRLPCLHLPCGKVASSPGPPAEPVVMRASGHGALHAHSRASAGLGHRPPPPPPPVQKSHGPFRGWDIRLHDSIQGLGGGRAGREAMEQGP